MFGCGWRHARRPRACGRWVRALAGLWVAPVASAGVVAGGSCEGGRGSQGKAAGFWLKGLPFCFCCYCFCLRSFRSLILLPVLIGGNIIVITICCYRSSIDNFTAIVIDFTII